MTELHDKTLALFFSHGISLKNWEDIGHLDREIKFYNCVASNFKQVCFFTYGGNEDLKYQNEAFCKVKIFPRPLKIPSWLYGLLMPLIYRKELKAADILKTNQMSASISAVLAKLLFRKKLLVRCGYEWLNVLQKEKKAKWKLWLAWLIEKIAYRLADKIIFTSQKDKQFAQKKFHIKEEKIALIPNYIDIDNFRPMSTEKENNSVVFVGRFSREKNLPNLIEAMSGLGLKLVLIGQGSQEPGLARFAKEKNVAVDFRGKIPNNQLPQELNKYEIFALPSLYEGCPKALLEAMACGLACLATNVEGIKEVISDKENGVLTSTDVFGIRNGLIFLTNNPEYRKVLGRKASETIASRFGLAKVLEQEMKLFSCF